MSDDKLKGKANVVKGEGKETWGNLTHDNEKVAEGNKDKAKGKAQEKAGELKDKFSNKKD
jgi:uncharacterized protein YjbJ (UPF0337 family)